jgi:tRNA-dihydrouridine synthase B
LLSIGDASWGNVFLAPLAGCTDLSFRLIARELGAKFAFFEMIDANALVHASGKNNEILHTLPEDQPIAAQILGGEPDHVLNAAKILLERVQPQFLDINAACPVRKVLRKGVGAQLLSDPVRLSAIIRKLVDNLPLPITVKLRVGQKKIDLAKAAELASACAESGASALFVHGRTRDQLYHGQVNYQAIKAMKEAVKIPVFGSGDVFSPELAKLMLTETGCDGVMVARGALGNPWIFKQIEHYLATGEKLPEPTWEERKTVLLRHLSYIQQYRRTRVTNKVGLMRKTALYYIKGIHQAAHCRSQITTIKDYETMAAMIEKLTP